jgi:hypothetical protein
MRFAQRSRAITLAGTHSLSLRRPSYRCSILL